MGIERASFLALVDLVRRIPHRPVRMLSLGYPDLLVSESILRACLPPGNWFKPAKDGDQIARWHGWNETLYDTDAVFAGLQIKPDYVDIYASRGIEKILDLNLPFQSHDDVASYDIVFDGGTVEHCFNIGQAIVNVATAVNVGGYVIHTNPMAMCNHGFWNLNPTTYIDFYEQNGFRILKLDALVGRPAHAEQHDIGSIERMQLPPEVRSLVVAQKEKAVGALRWPTQSKYLKNRELKA